MFPARLSPSEEWAKHCREEHPRRRVRKCVRNMLGTALMCCIGGCDWEIGLDR